MECLHLQWVGQSSQYGNQFDSHEGWFVNGSKKNKKKCGQWVAEQFSNEGTVHWPGGHNEKPRIRIVAKAWHSVTKWAQWFKFVLPQQVIDAFIFDPHIRTQRHKQGQPIKQIIEERKDWQKPFL